MKAADTLSEDLKLFRGLMEPGGIVLEGSEIDRTLKHAQKEAKSLPPEIVETPKPVPPPKIEKTPSLPPVPEEPEAEPVLDVSSEEGEEEEEQYKWAESPKPEAPPLPSVAGGAGSSSSSFESAEVDVDAENRDAQVNREKRELIWLLKKAYPTEDDKQWHMRLSLFELKWEWTKRQENDAELQSLVLMKYLLQGVIFGLQAANKKLGPIWNLDGWAESTTRDMSIYDRCLTNIYVRYFRKKPCHPLVELTLLIVGSAFLWHYQGNSTKQNIPAAAPRGPTPGELRPPPGRRANVPFEPGASMPDMSALFNLFRGGR